MNAFTVMQVEWRRLWRNKLGRAGLLVGLILPLLYSSLYLWAFWDPYGSLDKLPVAVVNQDQGGELSGKHINYGHDLEKGLVKDHTLDWHTESLTGAMRGLNGKSYYLVLRIPADFSANLLSVNTSRPHRAQLVFIPNQGRNYLAGQITKRVQSDIAASLNQQFSERYIAQLLNVVGREQNGISTIAKTANQLASASNHVSQGAASLNNGLRSVDDGAHKLTIAMSKIDTGSGQLASGIHQVHSGTVAAANGVSAAARGAGQIQSGTSRATGSASQLASGVRKVRDAAGQLAQSSTQLQSGTGSAAAGATKLAAGSNQASTGASQIESGLGQASSLLQGYQQAAGTSADSRVVQALGILQQLVPGAQNLTTALNQSQQGADQLASSLQSLSAGQGKLTNGISTLRSNLDQVATGTNQLSTSLGKLSTGMTSLQGGINRASAGLNTLTAAESRLASGATTLQNSIDQATTGMNDLQAGVSSATAGSNSLSTGASQLAGGTRQFSDQVAKANSLGKVRNPAHMAQMMSDPIAAQTQAVHPVDRYGPGLAPYFLPLSLWVGALMLYFLIALREGRWRIAPVSAGTVLLGKYALLWVIGAAQAVISATVLLYGLGLHVENEPLFYLFTIGLSITYITVIGMLMGVFGTGPGRFLAIALLLLQLTSSGGTFPVELVPGFFQAIHPWLPMSYAVEGLRNLIAFRDFSVAWRSLAITALYLVGSFVIMYAISLRRVHPRDLRQADELVS